MMEREAGENPVPEAAPAEHEGRQPYETPVLSDFGTVADMTQGAVNVGGDIIYS
jgi:hypothetical protein